MTITLFGHRITIFQVEKIAVFKADIDEATRKAEIEAIKNSESYKNIKAQVAAYREARNK